ncbi:hypothetical protein D3C76_1522350 [compost metagenome]
MFRLKNADELGAMLEPFQNYVVATPGPGMGHLGGFFHCELTELFCQRVVGLSDLIVVGAHLVEEAIDCAQVGFTLARLG